MDQDTIEFTVKAEKVVVSDTVKMVAIIAGLVGEKAEDVVREEIRVMMRNFVPDVDWQFSNQQRSTDTSGYERLNLTASARVSETENYNLDERSKAVSRKGLTISHVEVDTSIPADVMEEGERELRAAILTKVMAEQEALSRLSRRDYRISRLAMGSIKTTMQLVRGARGGDHEIAAASAAVSKQAYGSGMDEEGVLGNASKLTMTASVVLGASI